MCHRMGPLRMLYSVTLTYIFKVKLFKWQFWQENAGKCMHCYCHQIGSRVFISWPWPTFSRSWYFKCDYLKNGESYRQRYVIWLLRRLIITIERHHCECCTPWPWSSFSRIQLFLCICYKKNCASGGCPRQICLDSHGSRRGVALVWHSYWTYCFINIRFDTTTAYFMFFWDIKCCLIYYGIFSNISVYICSL